MSALSQNGRLYSLSGFKSEADLEQVIADLQAALFGPGMVYIPLKRKIGKQTSVAGIPDAYLLDFSNLAAPQFHVIEIELSTHDVIRHIGVQLFKFATAFKTSLQDLKESILKHIDKDEALSSRVQTLALKQFPNIDRALDRMLYGAEYSAIVIIDESSPDLDEVLGALAKKPVVIELRRYSSDGKHIYQFVPFHEDGEAQTSCSVEDQDIDTIIVPARKDGFEKVFLGESMWYSIRVAPKRIPSIKYCAGYQVAPVSAITHVAHVKEIRLRKGGPKYEVVFDGPAQELKHPVKGGGAKGVAPQGPCYTSHDRLQAAKNYSELMK